MNPKIERMFTYHPPQPGQPEKYQKIRDKAKELAYLIDELCPLGREQALALTKLQETTMWANAGIAMEGAEERDADSIPEITPKPYGKYPPVGN